MQSEPDRNYIEYVMLALMNRCHLPRGVAETAAKSHGIRDCFAKGLTALHAADEWADYWLEDGCFFDENGEYQPCKFYEVDDLQAAANKRRKDAVQAEIEAREATKAAAGKGGGE